MDIGTPLQILVVRDESDRRTDVYLDTLRLAFEGNAEPVDSPSAYLSDAVDLGIRVLEPSNRLVDSEIRSLVDGAEKTIVVRIGEASDLSARIGEHIASDRFVRVKAPPPEVRGPIQLSEPDEEEYAFAPVVATLRTMERARRVLTMAIDEQVNGTPSGVLKIFISHSKSEGLAVAKSLIGLLRQLKGEDQDEASFEYFYDAEHIPQGSYWKEVLKSNARSSVLVVLRTDSYDSRYWCRQEFLWAESNGMPILVVDLRKEQYYDSALLPFDVAPTIRLYDGNLIRVVLHAMSAHLRALRIESMTVKERVKVLPHRPSVYSLSNTVSDGGYDKIAHPAPKVPQEYRDAVGPILNSSGHETTLVSFDELE